jgi:hypothetical protein
MFDNCGMTNLIHVLQVLVDDKKFVKYPHYVGNKILLCGSKSSSFPFQCFVSVIS